MPQDPSGKNVVDLAEARKRQKTVRVGATAGRAKDPLAKPGKGKKIWQYLQLLLFLGVIAYLMQLCQHQA